MRVRHVSTVSPNASATPANPIPSSGNAAASTALPQPPRTSQNVPISSADRSARQGHRRCSHQAHLWTAAPPCHVGPLLIGGIALSFAGGHARAAPCSMTPVATPACARKLTALCAAALVLLASSARAEQKSHRRRPRA